MLALSNVIHVEFQTPDKRVPATHNMHPVETENRAAWELAQQYFPLAKKYVARRYSTNPKFEDILQEAYYGVFKAAVRFDPTRGVPFSALARWWIRQAITNSWKKNKDIPRGDKIVSSVATYETEPDKLRVGVELLEEHSHTPHEQVERERLHVQRLAKLTEISYEFPDSTPDFRAQNAIRNIIQGFSVQETARHFGLSDRRIQQIVQDFVNFAKLQLRLAGWEVAS